MSRYISHSHWVTDYTTNAFIAAYKRFTERRGICATLQSDCGTNFVGANAELRRLFESSSKELRHIASMLSNDNTEWKFNPPSVPHFGGKWEAAVKSTKYHLKRVLKDAILTYEELTTIRVQIEAVLNSRPLCPDRRRNGLRCFNSWAFSHWRSSYSYTGAQCISGKNHQALTVTVTKAESRSLLDAMVFWMPSTLSSDVQVASSFKQNPRRFYGLDHRRTISAREMASRSSDALASGTRWVNKSYNRENSYLVV